MYITGKIVQWQIKAFNAIERSKNKKSNELPRDKPKKYQKS